MKMMLDMMAAVGVVLINKMMRNTREVLVIPLRMMVLMSVVLISLLKLCGMYSRGSRHITLK